MTKRIFRCICSVAFGVYLIVLAVAIGVFYDGTRRQTLNALRAETNIVACGVEEGGYDYWNRLSADGYRFTWIGKDGKVLYDSSSDADELENHLNREEVKQALVTGVGMSSRYSDTILSMQYYCAQSISDGTVVRLSVSHDSVWAMLAKLIYPIIYSSLAIIGVCVFIAYRISKSVVKPINEIDLGNPESNDTYKEIQPLLSRLGQQQRSIRMQENELQRQREEFNAITYGMKEGLVLLNEKNEIVSVNHAAQSLFGKSGDLIGKPFSSLAPIPEFVRAEENGQSTQRESLRAEWNKSVLQMDVTPIFSNGARTGAVVLLQDVTQKEQAELMRREFTSNVSHELKTPLHAISGHAELLLNGLVKPEDEKTFIKNIYDESSRMIVLVEDIIRLSSLEEETEIVREEVDVWQCVRETVASLKSTADTAGVYLSVEGSSVKVKSVARLLSVVTYNLVDNAIKYNREQGKVSVLVKEEEANVVVCVRDTGIGIPLEDQERVFERFYRVDKSRSKSVGGTGLGLSIVKHAVRILGGKIELFSKAGEGTTVIVKLPKE